MVSNVGASSTPPGEESEEGGRRHIIVGLWADPELAPAEITRRLSDILPGRLADQIGDDYTWEVRVRYERLPATSQECTPLLELAGEWVQEDGCDLAVCITDLPLRIGKQPLVADVSVAQCAAVVSLPAFGGMRLLPRVRRVAVQVVAELMGRGASGPAGKPPRAVYRLTGHFDLLRPTEGQIDVRIVASRGRFRLLTGMIRANRPWRIALGLTGATAAAFAISAFYVVNSSVWDVSNDLGVVRHSLAMIASLAALVGWLIIRHGMWERPHHADLPHERDEVVLFNVSTLVTLTIGMTCMYAVVFLVNFAATLLVVPADVLQTYIGHPPDSATYLSIAWLTSSAAAVGGALGSGLDSDKSVRQAAYSYRERQRRTQREVETSERDAEGHEAAPER